MEKLAILGGKPVRDTFLPYGKQTIEEDDIENVVEVLKSDYLTTGPKVKEFEEEVAKYIGVNYAVAFSNGTAALHAAVKMLDLTFEDEVIVSSLTFMASSNCVLYSGAKPVFADVNPDTMNIDIKDIEKRITKNTKAIIAVDLTGQSADMDSIIEIAQKYDLKVIEDAAHSLGSKYKNKAVGQNADMTIFSFHPVKTITTGEGGMVVTDCKDYYDKLKMFRSHGVTRDRKLITKDDGPWYYEQQFLGYNYRLTDIQASLGISQMRKLDRFIRRRNEIAEIYNKEFKNINGIKVPFESEYSQMAYHIYVLKLELRELNVSRKEIFEALLAENIGVNVHYLPVYLHPYYQELGYLKGECINAEKLYDSIITIPLFPSMTNSDAYDVVRGVKKVISYYRKKNV